MCMLLVAILLVVAGPAFSQTTCSLPSPKIEIDGPYRIVRAVNECEFDVRIRFRVTGQNYSNTPALRLRACGGKDEWKGPTHWKLDNFTYEYNDSRRKICRASTDAAKTWPPQ